MSNAFCSHCVELNEIPGKPAGQETEVAGLKTYVAKGSKKGTVVIATDIYGHGIDNPFILADKLASASGFTTVVPDIFKGDPIAPKDFKLKKHADDSDPEGADKNFDNFGAWLGKGHTPDKTYPLIKAVIDHYAKDGPVALTGYCYGGKLCSLAAQDGVVKGVSIQHPAMLEKGEASSFKVPALLQLAEVDPIFNGETKQDWLDTLKSKSLLDDKSQTFDKTVHGFAIRPDFQKPEIKKAFETATDNSVAFFQKVLV